MSATSHEWDGAGAADAETAGERLQGWSVAVAVGHPGSPRTWRPF